MKKKVYSFRINVSLLDELEDYSLRNYTSASDTIRKALFSYLANDKRKERNSGYDA